MRRNVADFEHDYQKVRDLISLNHKIYKKRNLIQYKTSQQKLAFEKAAEDKVQENSPKQCYMFPS